MCSLFSVPTKSVYCCLCVQGRGTDCRSWIASQGPNPWRNRLLPPQQLSIVRSSSHRGGTSGAPPWCMLGFWDGMGLCVRVVLAAVSPVCHCPVLAHKLANTQKWETVAILLCSFFHAASCVDWDNRRCCGRHQGKNSSEFSQAPILCCRHNSNLYILQEHCISHASAFPNRSLKIRSAHILLDDTILKCYLLFVNLRTLAFTIIWLENGGELDVQGTHDLPYPPPQLVPFLIVQCLCHTQYRISAIICCLDLRLTLWFISQPGKENGAVECIPPR